MSNANSSTRQVIEIVVSPAGEVVVQTRGFAGASCRDASRLIEQALGQRTAEQLTPEFYQTLPVQQQANVNGGSSG